MKFYFSPLFLLVYVGMAAQSLLTAQIDSVFSCISVNLSRDYLNICISRYGDSVENDLAEFDLNWYAKIKNNPELLGRSNKVLRKATILALMQESRQDSLLQLFKHFFDEYEGGELDDASFLRMENLTLRLSESICYIPSSSIALEFIQPLKLHRKPSHLGYDVGDPNLSYLINCISSKLTEYGNIVIWEQLGDDHRDNEAWDEVILRLQTDSTLWKPEVWDGAEYKMD